MEQLLSDYLTPTELAHQLRATRRTIDRWANLRTGPPRVRLGGKVYYRRQSVLDWLARQEERPPCR